MITIPRLLLRQFRSTCRRVRIKSLGDDRSLLTLLADGTGLTIRATSADMLVAYHQPGEFANEQQCVPLSFLADCEGAKQDLVTLEAQGRDKIAAHWTDGQIPQLIEYEAGKSEDVPAMPDIPQTLTENDPGLWRALRDASQCTDNASSRYALGYIQLRGSDGRVAATDGRQVFAQSGFQFPWENETHILGSSLFASRELPQDQPVKIGSLGEWVTLALGPWTFQFSTLKDGKFPQLDEILKGAELSAARLHVAPTDAEFLLESLPRLPTSDIAHEPITLDLNGQIVVRARSAADAAPTELIATNSRWLGDAMLLETNRKFLLHALRLGFREVNFRAPHMPALGIDGNRRYLWALLGADGAVRASENSTRIESPAETDRRQVSPRSTHRSSVAMSPTTQESTASSQESAPATKPKIQRSKPEKRVPLLDQVVALRNQLRVTVNQANDLIRGLKQQRKQSRLVATTLASLKELQKVAG